MGKVLAEEGQTADVFHRVAEEVREDRRPGDPGGSGAPAEQQPPGARQRRREGRPEQGVQEPV